MIISAVSGLQLMSSTLCQFISSFAQEHRKYGSASRVCKRWTVNPRSYVYSWIQLAGWIAPACRICHVYAILMHFEHGNKLPCRRSVRLGAYRVRIGIILLFTIVGSCWSFISSVPFSIVL